MTVDTYTEANAWRSAGTSVVPVADDGSKRPAINWKAFQHTAAGTDEIDLWFGDITGDPDPNNYGVGVICGAVSGQLEMFEFEGRAVDAGLPARFREAMEDHGHADLWNTVSTGYLEQTPSGGLHLLYRVDGTARGNTKLARRPATDTELAAASRDKGQGAQKSPPTTMAAPPAPLPGSQRPSVREQARRLSSIASPTSLLPPGKRVTEPSETSP